MIFSSAIFIFLFLPVVIILYYFADRRIKNLILLLASLIFYAWGEPGYIMLMILSIIVNWGISLLIDRQEEVRSRKAFFIIALIFNIGMLVIFKYLNFILGSLNEILGRYGIVFTIEAISLPIGISFYTFQIVSYIIDLYCRKIKVQKSIINLGMYIFFFPQLIAGPIVRYIDISDQIDNRKESVEKFSYGIFRFVIGLGKKVLIANNMAIVTDNILALESSEWYFGIMWIAMLCYTLQIYFDFSGYSDMAIGLGHIFGFDFNENFRYPYMAKNIKDFWRRWHISLSGWLRDYVYIPLGGNRKGPGREYLNRIIVFLLCGIWHGANWTFVIWGIWHGMFLIIESISSKGKKRNIPVAASWLYTFLVVIIGWTFFRAENISEALLMLKTMSGLNGFEGNYFWNELLSHEAAGMAVAGMVLAFPVIPKVLKVDLTNPKALTLVSKPKGLLMSVAVVSVFILSVISITSGTYNPFIYFRF